jgi:membrane protein DedA with SNARE-associated domain
MNFAELIANHPWAMYGIAILLPFVQEDAAVIGAASAAAAGHGDPAGLFVATLVGLIMSDTWKYWAGRFAHAHPGTAKLAADKRVIAARDRVVNRLGVALMIARFVPGTRIPLYVACGLFKAPFWRFFVIIIFSGALYLAIAFIVLATLGAAVGEQVRGVIPFVVVGLILTLLAGQWIAKRLRKGAE